MAMVGRNRTLIFLTHVALAGTVLVLFFPIYIVFVASTNSLADILSVPMPLVPGLRLFDNYMQTLLHGARMLGAPVGVMMLNSLIMALGISLGKIAVALLAAFAIVFFSFRFRMVAFWLIFATIMLPVEVRILPTYQVVARLGLLNSYAGLILPLMASATATFLFRQFFLSVPGELAEAAKIDGAGPMVFFWSVLLPISRTAIAALFIVLFVFGWNQYLWPLLVSTKRSFYTILIGIKSMTYSTDNETEWHLVMAATVLAMVPPILVVISMQKLFVRGLTEHEK